MLCRALTYRRIRVQSPEAIQTTYDESVSGWLEDFLAESPS